VSIVNAARTAVGLITRNNDLTLVALMVAVIAMMILPLPTFLVDALIGGNIALSFLMLMMSLYVPGALHFSSFPTMLLFTTLFRLGLNITTTRLILLQADAGQIIFTFGEFAVGGNFIVGAVVFIILTIVQFIVIAKGAERVSEVGARFTLDAMPGKQMSIDADLRAGVINMDEAQKRRQMVSQESQMYGAMDGAMKFVKGDSIAGLITAAVNIVAGTLIGVLQNGLSAGEALQLYGILTIGDGLVSQIPSLLVAISAGILVTRAGSESDNVGALIGDQIFSQPKALLVASALVFVFALVPGFPKPQLFALSLALAAIGRTLKFISQAPVETDPKKELSKTIKSTISSSKKKTSAPPRDEFAPVVPIILDISPPLGESLDYESLNEDLSALRRALYFDLGVPFPGINLRPNPHLTELSYALHLNEIPIAKGQLEPNMVLVREDTENLKMAGIEARESPPFIPGLASLWAPEAEASTLTKAGLKYMDHSRIIAFHLSLVLTRHAGNFVGLQEAKYLLDKMEEQAPDLVREATRLLPVQKIAEIFQRLVQEHVSIRDLRNILEALIEWSPREKDSIMLVEYVRGNLKRQISYMYSSGQNILPVILMENQVEETIRKAIRQTSSGAFLALDPQYAKNFLAAVGKIADKYARQERRPVLMASIDIRRYVRRLIEADYYEFPVISYQELTPEISAQPLAKINI
jgi:type III secretion protein V